MAKNYAFIDTQNMFKGVKAQGWRVDFIRFRVYLREKYDVAVAYAFLGYIPSNRRLYAALEQAGFVLKFKPVIISANGEIKGNVDGEIILQAMVQYDLYDQAVLVSSDGDFHCLVEYLDYQGKLCSVLSPHRANCSALLKKAAKGRVQFMDDFIDKIATK